LFLISKVANICNQFVSPDTGIIAWHCMAIIFANQPRIVGLQLRQMAQRDEKDTLRAKREAINLLVMNYRQADEHLMMYNGIDDVVGGNFNKFNSRTAETWVAHLSSFIARENNPALAGN